MVRLFKYNSDTASDADMKLFTKVSLEELTERIDTIIQLLSNMWKAASIAAAKGDEAASTERIRVKECLDTAKTFRDCIVADNSDAYFIPKRIFYTTYANTFKEVEDLYHNTYKMIPCKRYTYKYKLTEVGAFVDTHEFQCRALVTWSRWGYDAACDETNDYTTIRNKVNDINDNCRIYKCKSCGKLCFTSNDDDKFLKSKGLKPRQRCYNCSKKK